MLSYLVHNKWKVFIGLSAVMLAGWSMIYTNSVVSKLKDEEREKIEIWAEALKEFKETPLDGEISMYLFRILYDNKTIPRILVNNNGEVVNTVNIEFTPETKDEVIARELAKMKRSKKPIEIKIGNNAKNYIYYKDSILLEDLRIYPYVMFIVISLFLVGVYFALNTYRKAEQNMLWVGMSKETAHQLGTPISSLLAWIEYMKLKDEDNVLIEEVSKDVKRLEKITERFSRIGSAPKLSNLNIIDILLPTIEYLKGRSSSTVNFIQDFDEKQEVVVPINAELFEWVIENLWKNALDAMNNTGEIEMKVYQNESAVFIELKDSGKGIPKSKFQTIFKPGFTTKKRGWGLGLSLTKRIIKDYHKGKIYVLSSEIGVGTTFKIELFKDTLTLSNNENLKITNFD